MKRLYCLIISIVLVQAANAAAEFQYYVFPVPSITGISESAVDNTVSAAALGEPKFSGMINAEYAQILLPPETQKSLLKTFSDEVAAAFPTAVIGANQVRSSREGSYALDPYENSQCDPKFKASYKDTFALAMGISRLSVYSNVYDEFADLLIPITYTIRFVKLNGASTVFSQSNTIYTRYSGTKASVFDASGKISKEVVNTLRVAILNDGSGILREQVKEAARSFSPKQTDIAVTGRDGKYIFFDRGSEVGFSSEGNFDAIDEKGEDVSFNIVYASDTIAIGVAADEFSNGVKAGQSLRFSFSKQGRDDAKPSLFAMQYSGTPESPLTQPQVLSNALSAIIADDIGFKAPFNIVKHDPDFIRLKNQIRSEASCESTIFREMAGFADNTTTIRQPPDYVMRIDALNSPAFSVWGAGKAKENTDFVSTVSISLIDRGSAVRNVFTGSDSYTLERTGGKGLSLSEAEEVNVKNAALRASQLMVKDFLVSQMVIPFASVDAGEARLVRSLPFEAFSQARLVRPLTDGKKKVLLPLPRGEAFIVKPEQSTDKVKTKGEIRKSDLLQVANVEIDKIALLPCKDKKSILVMGTGMANESGLANLLARNVFHSSKTYTLYEVDERFLTSVERAYVNGSFSESSVSRENDSQLCFIDIELQKADDPKCDLEGCSGAATLLSGIRIYKGDEKIAESVAAAKASFSAIQSDALSSFVGLKTYENHLGSIPKHQLKLN